MNNETIKEVRGEKIKLLIDQLYKFEGVLGNYNCQHGGLKCDFQINCHRLIREEIQNLQDILDKLK